MNTADGAHLFTGDAVHTAKGWLGPTRDAQALKQYLDESWESVDHLRELAAQLPGITIHPGHQSFPPRTD
ncbi:MAG: hypothetical protein JKX88_00225 [Marinicaulis sp.]|nr:hypothetical protein [Marinicaulis sp.]